MRQLADFEAFMALSKHLSLTGAAKALKLPKSTISRRLTHLEKDLGQTLAIRNGKGVELTEAGHIFAIYCQQLLEMAELSRDALQEFQEEASGRLCIAVHAALKRGWLMQVLNEFMLEHPGIRLELYTQQLTGQESEGIDLWLWLGDFPKTGYRRERLGSWVYGLFASPDYLHKNGTPKHPEELIKHKWVDWVGVAKEGLSLYHAQEDSFTLAAIDSRWKTDSLVLQADAIKQGQGIGFLPLWQAARFEAAHPGSLQPCLQSWQTAPVDIALHYPLGRPPKRLSLLLQALRANRPSEWLDPGCPA